jgi:hypothetical protein
MVFNKPEQLEEEYSEEASYTQKEFSIKEIILRHLRKIGDICCSEFKEGYWNKKPVRTQSGIVFSETYNEDTRQAYCNAIDFLIDIIYPKGDLILKYYLSKHEGFTLNKKDSDEIDRLKQKGDIINGEKEKTPEEKKKEDELDEDEKIDLKLQQKRNTFRQINLMFERINFWTSSDSSNE